MIPDRTVFSMELAALLQAFSSLYALRQKGFSIDTEAESGVKARIEYLFVFLGYPPGSSEKVIL
jgi:hypothetical protein